MWDSRWVVVVMGICWGVGVSGEPSNDGSTAAITPAVEKRLTDKLHSLFSEADISAISLTPISGIYEVVLDQGYVIYVTKDGNYAFEGNLMDLEKQENLTQARRAGLRAEVLKGLAADSMIEFAPEQVKNTVYAFTDIDCGYCRRMHNEVDTLNEAGIAVRYLAYPRGGIGSESFKKTVSVWCAKDKKKALTEAKLGRKVEPEKCENPVAEQFALGQRMGIRGTPAVFLEDGKQIGGYVPASQIIKFFDGKL